MAGFHATDAGPAQIGRVLRADLWITNTSLRGEGLVHNKYVEVQLTGLPVESIRNRSSRLFRTVVDGTDNSTDDCPMVSQCKTVYSNTVESIKYISPNHDTSSQFVQSTSIKVQHSYVQSNSISPISQGNFSHRTNSNFVHRFDIVQLTPKRLKT